MCEKAWSRSRSRSRSSEPVSAGPETEKEHSALVVDAEWCGSSEGKPSDEKIVTLALANVAALERRCAALEKKSQEAARSPEANEAVVQQIAALRKSLEDKSPQGTKSSSSFEKELVLVRPVKGVDKEGCLILGDPKLLRASALKS